MQREVTDEDGIAWTCIQAFAGLGEDPQKSDAARVEGTGNLVHVVCTPSGGARSVRLEFPKNWDEVMADQALLDAIALQKGERQA